MKTLTQSAVIYVLLSVLLACLTLTACGSSGSGGGTPTVTTEDLWYIDQDGDGFGVSSDTKNDSEQPEGYVDNAFDCDDSDKEINPMMKNCPGTIITNGIVPDTGQTTSYTDTFGEDSDFLIDPASYTKLDSDGQVLSDDATSWAMVKDNVTGLIWERKDNSNGIHSISTTYSWNEASSFIDTLNAENFGGFTDDNLWRLPTIRELCLLFNTSTASKYLPLAAQAYILWSSTPYNEDTSWGYFLLLHINNTFDKTRTFPVIAVRGQTNSSTFVELGSGIIQDTSTGLMWQQVPATGDNSRGMTFEDALSYCSNLTLGGFQDWRLPNKNEFVSLIRFDLKTTGIDPQFSDAVDRLYWTSTTVQSNETYNYNFSSGTYFCSYTGKENNAFVRAVRGGNNLNKRNWYWDGDKDGYGDPAAIYQLDSALPRPERYTSDNTDCNDNDSTIYPRATEVPDDGIDQNCSGKDQLTWYRDSDEDGYGSKEDTKLSEGEPVGYIRNTTQIANNDFDCNDENVAINPGMEDLLDDGLDNDCSVYKEGVDPDYTQNRSWYIDQDGDGYGAGQRVSIGELPLDTNLYVSNGLDCDDNDASVHPGMIGTDGCNSPENIEAQKIIPDTGQTTKFTTIEGEDADFIINPPSYIKISSGGGAVILDEITGLYWEVKTDTNESLTYTYSEAKSYITGLNQANFAGYSDWRMPSITEVAIVADLDKANPAINTDYFDYIYAGHYWTNSDSGSSTNTLTLNFSNSASYVSSKTDNHYYVIAVRGGKETVPLIDNNDGTVTESHTGLMWNGVDLANGNWSDNKSFWAGQTSCGYSDWRLPTESEFNSLLNILSNNPSISLADYFSITNLDSTYWSCTLFSEDASRAIAYSFSSGETSIEPITDTLFGFGVRGTKMSRFIDNGDGTIFDRKTGLMWLKENGNNNTALGFKDALTYCNTLEFAGYDNWRIPNRNELLSLLDGAINSWDEYVQAFPSTAGLYWSSSSSASIEQFAWQIDFTQNAWGISLGNYYTQFNAIRAVRDGNF